MSIESIIAATTEAVSGVSTEFTVAGAFWLFGTGFAVGEGAIIEGIGPDGNYRKSTNKEGFLHVSAFPNTVYCDLPAGTYRINKAATVGEASVGFEEPV